MIQSARVVMSELAWPWGLLCGVTLGVLGGAVYLGVTFMRARAACEGRPRVSLLLLPVAFAGPAVAVLLAAACSKLAAWSTLLGIVAVRSWVLPRVGVRDAK